MAVVNVQLQCQWGAALRCCLSMVLPLTEAFMYRPLTGLTWDPSCMSWEGRTYCYFMYVCGSSVAGCGGKNESHYGHGLVAVSDDGVHFSDHSAFNAEFPGVVWDKCMVHKLADEAPGKPLFVMDHGTAGQVIGPDDPDAHLPDDRGCPAGTHQCLRFLKSNDALTWEYMYTLHPDTRWYKAQNGVSTSRWDHAYIQEDEQRGGYIAFPVATPAHTLPAPGVLRSRDGLNWTVEPPVETDWSSGVAPSGFEIGGVERMGNGRYYMIGGGEAYGFGYSMFTLRSQSTDVAGPYAPDAGAFRLSGQSKGMMRPSFDQALAAWARDYDTYPAPGSALISQYMVMPHTPDIAIGQHSLAGGGHVWLLPFRQPILEDEHLRLAHWAGNVKMRGQPLPAASTLSVAAPAGLNMSTAFIADSEYWDHLQGVVIAGTLSVPATAAAVGVVISTETTDDCTTPCDAGPDVQYDRVGNDEHCFSVNRSYTAVDCAAACEAAPMCQAWTLVQAHKAPATHDVVYPCAKGLPLTAPYCTLKAPFPSAPIRKSQFATTGVARRAMSNLQNHTRRELTAMMMDVSPAGNSTKVWQVSGATKVLRDVSGPFECGSATHQKTCLPATTVAVEACPSLPFIAYFRHGTFELYVGTPLMLVQTTVYGTYPQAHGAVGFAVEGPGAAGVKIAGLQAWKMNLKAM